MRPESTARNSRRSDVLRAALGGGHPLVASSQVLSPSYGHDPRPPPQSHPLLFGKASTQTVGTKIASMVKQITVIPITAIGGQVK